MDLDDSSLLSSSNPIALVFYAAKSALRAKEELQRYNYLYTVAGLLAKRGWNMKDKRDLLLFIERIINLKDKTFKRQYWEYRQQLDKEGKIVYEHFLKDIEEEIVEQRGFEKGIEKGLEKGKEEMARNLLTHGISPDVIAQSAGLPVEQVRMLIK